MQFVRPPHHGQIAVGHWTWRKVDAATAEAEKLRLAHDGEFVLAVDHFFPPSDPAFTSFSTTTYLISNQSLAPGWLDLHDGTFHFVPTCCSWLKAVEGFFAKPTTLRRLKRGVFHSVVALQAAINRLVKEQNQEPLPFTWKANPADHCSGLTRAPNIGISPLARRPRYFTVKKMLDPFGEYGYPWTASNNIGNTQTVSMTVYLFEKISLEKL